MEEKWFIPLQKIAKEKLDELYPEPAATMLNYQEITSWRVFEQRTVVTKDNEAVKEVMIVMRKSPSAVFVYELNVVASN
jgi:hypothetical protein